MSTVPVKRLTAEEYLAIERASIDQKHEFYAGEMFAMAGGTQRHNKISAQVIRWLGNQTAEKPCDVFTSDMRVLVERTGLYTYPDAIVACGEVQTADDKDDVLLNPILVVEVLSDSTENYDRGKKFGHYRQIPSLREYLLVSQDEPVIERFSLADDGRWALDDARGMEASIKLDLVEFPLPLAEVYRRIDFTERPE